jgi:MYXO-CTERM domain-containing protein
MLSTSLSAHAATIATWTFETSLPTTGGPISPEVGSGSATAVHATPGNFTNPSGNGSAESYNSDSWTVGDYYQFQVSTLGQTGISLAWDQTRSSSGPGFQDLVNPNFKLQYSTDGTNFTDVVNYLVPVVAWSSGATDASTKYSQNLSSITALNNQAAVYFRLTSILGDQPTSTAGTSRMDNISVTSIPEPASLALATAGVVAAAAMRRRTT